MNLNTHSRRSMLRMSASSLLAAGLWPGRLWAADKDTGSFRFVVINDLHYQCPECADFFSKLVEQVNGTKGDLDFCILAGDLSDNGTPEQLGPLREIVDKLRCKVVTVPGNHDHLKDNRQPYEQAFPKSTNQHFDHKGWQFVGLDTCDGKKSNKVAASKATLDYVDGLLPTLDRSRPTVVFTHFPLNPKTKYCLTNAGALLDRFKGHHLAATYGGHFHGFTEGKAGDTVLTTNRCCSLKRNNHDGTQEEGYFVVEARDGLLKREFVPFAVG